MNVQKNLYESVSETPELTHTTKVSPRGRLSSGEPNPVDVHVGQRARMRRLSLGMSQERLGSVLGITFQQVQKYERGANRIGASRLWDLSLVLKCPVSFFYEDMADRVSNASPRNLARSGRDVSFDHVDEASSPSACRPQAVFYADLTRATANDEFAARHREARALAAEGLLAYAVRPRLTQQWLQRCAELL